MQEFIELIKYLILGLIQGFSEPLPISSSGHLIIFEKILDMPIKDFNFEIIVNTGSLIAVLLFYQHDLITLIKNNYQYIFRKQTHLKADFHYLLYIILATIPAALVGYFFINYINHFKSLLTVGIALIFTACALFFINSKGMKNNNEKINIKTAIVMGLVQILALIPGISRSGSTTIAGLSQDVKIEPVLRFSFFMYIPISIASLVLSIIDLQKQIDVNYLGYTIAFLASLITTYIGIKFLLKIVKQAKLKYFGYYCLLVGSIAIFFHIFV